MTRAHVAAKHPIRLDLGPGKYSWCACGRSASQPFCDGSHAGTEQEPLEFEITETQRVSLCQCKQTARPPYCDGTHKTL